jgi:uncharacterized phage infection (PIP) family protein YhgE
MRRTIFLTLGTLEFVVAIVLVYLALQVPGKAEVSKSFGTVERVTRKAGHQVRLVRQQVGLLRRPQLKDLARRLKEQTRQVTALLKEQKVDFKTVHALREALGEVGDGLDNLSKTLDPSGVRQLGNSLGETATFLEDKIVPGAAEIADQLDKSSKVLKADAQRLKAFLRTLPTDLEAVQEVHDGLGQFSQGLGRVNALLRTDRLGTIREGFDGMENSLRLGAGQVERLAGFTYPVLTFDGLRPEIERRSLWPEGKEIGKGLRKAATGMKAVGKGLDDLAKDLPQFRKAVQASRKLVERSRDSLEVALKHRSQVEPLLKDMPEHAQRLADSLPRVGKGLAKVLRDTDRLKEVARGLRVARKSIDGVADHWPDLCAMLGNSATLLRTMQYQLDQALLHRGDYQKVANQMVLLADAFAVMLPYLTDQLLGQMAEEEQALNELGTSIDEVGEMVPAYGEMTGRFLQIGRFLAWLVAAIVGLHGTYLVLSAKMGRRFSI